VLKKGIVAIFVAALLVLSFGCQSEEKQGEVAATVNGENITMDEYQSRLETLMLSYEQQGADFEGEEGEEMKAQVEQMAIQNLIQQKAFMQKAEEKNSIATQEQLDGEIEQIKTQFESEEKFQEALENNQLTENEFESMLKFDLTMANYMEENVEEVEVTESEVQEAYESYAQQMQGMEEGAQVPKLEELRPDLEEMLKGQKQQEQMTQIMEEIMENSDIETFI